MSAEELSIVTLILSIIAVVLSSLSYLRISETRAKMEMLEKAPVLRQYVERFVPIDNSEEAQKVIQKKMLEQERAFDESLGLAPLKSKNKFAEHNILRAEELV